MHFGASDWCKSKRWLSLHPFIGARITKLWEFGPYTVMHGNLNFWLCLQAIMFRWIMPENVTIESTKSTSNFMLPIG